MTDQHLPAPGSTERTRVRRIPEKAVADRDVLHDVLDAGLVAHVGIVDEPASPSWCRSPTPATAIALLIHGSTGSRLFRRLADGAPACVTVTLLDGLVLARSAFESSMNYRGVMVLGTLHGPRRRRARPALRLISDHLLPGRWDDIRPPSRKELAATLVLSMPLAEASVKVSDKPPEDDPQDLDRPVWGGRRAHP